MNLIRSSKRRLAPNREQARVVRRSSFFFVAALFVLTGNGCSVPHFDIPTDSAGQPTPATIVQRIQCEIRDMVRDDKGDKDVTSFHRLFLLNGDYDVAASLSLEVTDTGGLAPSLSYINPLTMTASFIFGGTATLSEARNHNFTENIQFSVRQIYADWKSKKKLYNCPQADTNLAGTLGIKDFVAMAAVTDGLVGAEPTPEAQPAKPATTQFGGSIQFIVTKNLSSLGPTWSLVHFKGPGGLVNLSEVNTDKITLAFAQGPNAGKRLVTSNTPNFDAYRLLQQILTSSINSQLLMLQNSLP
jgi:hypothetical protein